MSPLPPFPVDVAEFNPADEVRLHEAATILYRAAAPYSSAFPTPEAALGELLEITRQDGGLTFIAVNLAGEVCGLVAAGPWRSTNLIRIYPMFVDPPFQRRGVGQALLKSLEAAAESRGATTLMIALEDEAGLTSMSHRSLFPDPLAPMTRFIPPASHPSRFLQRMGFALTGVLPDAAGPGRPELWFARAIGSESNTEA